MENYVYAYIHIACKPPRKHKSKEKVINHKEENGYS